MRRRHRGLRGIRTELVLLLVLVLIIGITVGYIRNQDSTIFLGAIVVLAVIAAPLLIYSMAMSPIHIAQAMSSEVAKLKTARDEVARETVDDGPFMEPTSKRIRRWRPLLKPLAGIAAGVIIITLDVAHRAHLFG